MIQKFEFYCYFGLKRVLEASHDVNQTFTSRITDQLCWRRYGVPNLTRKTMLHTKCSTVGWYVCLVVYLPVVKKVTRKVLIHSVAGAL